MARETVDADRERESVSSTREHVKVRNLTPEQIRRGLAAMDRIEQLQMEIMERRGGVPFPPSWELINEARDESTRQLNDCR